MKQLFEVVNAADRVLSCHESKKEAKKERDKHNALGGEHRVRKGVDHYTKHINPWK